MRAKPALLAILASLPLALIAARAVVLEVRDFRDPCLRWGQSSMSGSGIILAPSTRMSDPCATRISGTSETRAVSVVRTLLVPVGILLGITLGILGAARSRYRLTVAGAWLILVEAVPLIFSVAPLAVLTGGVFLWAAHRLRPSGTVV